MERGRPFCHLRNTPFIKCDEVVLSLNNLSLSEDDLSSELQIVETLIPEPV